MKKAIEAIYKCDYCTKISKSAGAMVRHEKYCNKNPQFYHPCFTCKNLKRKVVELTIHSHSEFEEDSTQIGTIPSYEFYCSIHGDCMHPKKAELSRIKDIAENFGKVMPNECEDQCFDETII